MVSSTPRPHFTPRKDRVPIVQEAGWGPGLVWMGGKSHPHRDSIPDRPARSQSLYRLSYRAHKRTMCLLHNDNFVSRELLRTNKINSVLLRTVEEKTALRYILYPVSNPRVNKISVYSLRCEFLAAQLLKI